MVAAATIVSMAGAKKAQQNVFALYHSYNRAILLGFIWILDFHFQIVLILRRRYLIPIRCSNGKRKMWPWGWLHHFDFSTDDGCTRWWRWLHYFGRVICDTHTAPCRQISLRYRPYEVTIPLGWASEGGRAPQFRQRILLFLRCHLTVPHGSGQSRIMCLFIGCMIVVKCDTCKICGAYAHLGSITSTVVILVIDIACRSLILIKNVYFVYFLPNSKLIYGWSDTTNLNCRWVQNIINFK